MAINADDADRLNNHDEVAATRENAEGLMIDPVAVEDFWQNARKCIRSVADGLAVVLGPDARSLSTPPAFLFGDNPAMATELAQLVVDERKTATSSLLAEYERDDESLPQIGDMAIVCDGAGQPVAALSTVAVEQYPFDQVPVSVAEAEGEGDRTLLYWRQTHTEFFSRVHPDLWVGDGTDIVVVEHFQVFYPGN